MKMREKFKTVCCSLVPRFANGRREFLNEGISTIVCEMTSALQWASLFSSWLVLKHPEQCDFESSKGQKFFGRCISAMVKGKGQLPQSVIDEFCKESVIDEFCKETGHVVPKETLIFKIPITHMIEPLRNIMATSALKHFDDKFFSVLWKYSAHLIRKTEAGFAVGFTSPLEGSPGMCEIQARQDY